jgi:hypothetical protein
VLNGRYIQLWHLAYIVYPVLFFASVLFTSKSVPGSLSARLDRAGWRFAFHIMWVIVGGALMLGASVGYLVMQAVYFFSTACALDACTQKVPFIMSMVTSGLLGLLALASCITAIVVWCNNPTDQMTGRGRTK